MSKTRTHTPQPLSPMLENAFASALENRFAEVNNHLAREGRLTNDPIVLALRGVRRALTEDHGITFERVSVKPVAVAPAATPKVTKGAKGAAKATPVAKTTKVAATAPATTGRQPKPRTIKEAQISELQVAGSIDEAVAPYGRDEAGRALAPYGIKNDGITPMKRRGRTASAPAASAAPVATPAAGEDSLDDLLADL